MRQTTRFALAFAILLVVLFGAYTVYWVIVAGRLKEGFADWARSMQAQQLDIGWRKIRVAGYPASFRIEVEVASLRDARTNPAPELRIPSLKGSTAPWDFRNWTLVARYGLSGTVPSGGNRPVAEISAQAARGAVSVVPQGRTTIWATLQQMQAAAGPSFRVALADSWVILPERGPATHEDPSFELAFRLHDIALPPGLTPFSGNVDDFAAGITLKGAWPPGGLRQAATAWRDAGGTLELDRLRLIWGAMGVNASGTLALDKTLQPEGAFSGGVQGYDQILTGLMQAGRIPSSNAGLARLGLSMFAKPGPDGQSEIRTNFTIQNGQMMLGPLKLGAAPRIVWE